MLHWSINQIKLDLKYTWKISRNATTYKINSIITCSDEFHIGQGEVAPNIRYNETPELILNSFEQFVNAGANQIKNASELSVILNQINAPNAMRFGIEQAYIHYLCAQNNQTIYEFLKIEKPLRTIDKKTWFGINLLDILTYDMFTPVFIEYYEAFFIVSKIKQYDYTSDETTEVELIKIN
jgi:hypothetical protein